MIKETAAFLDDLDVAVIVALPDGKIDYINRAAINYFPEYENLTVLSHETFDLNSESDEYEFQIEKGDKVLRVSAKKIIKRKKLLGIKFLMTDITGLLYLEKQVEKNSMENSKLLTNISHEIRTPLNAIIGASEVLATFARYDAANVDIIRNAALKANSMLDELLSSVKGEAEIGGQASGRMTAAGAKALVVDDNKVNLLMAKQILEQLGVETDIAESGFACINILENGASYDIIFMDYMMEGMSGTEATEYIRRLKGNISTVPIIAFTANSVEGAREMYLSAGMNDCLFKPAGKQAFADMLKKYVSGKLLFPESNPHKDAGKGEYPSIEGINYEDAEKYSAGNADVFKDILATFYVEVPERIERIQNCLNNNDLKNFVVEVHGVKSQARTMGMRGLSSAMADMEKAGMDGNYDYINAELEDLFELYRMWADRVKPVAEEKTGAVKRTAGKEKAECILIKIRDLLGDFEMEDAEAQFRTIWPGEYSEERMELMQKLKASIEDIDYYASLDYVDKLLDTYSKQ